MPVRTLVVRVFVTLASAAAPALACAEDGDGVCDAIDDRPAVANPAQSDVDAGLAGDACDDSDTAVDVTVLQPKRGTSEARGERAITVKDDFIGSPDRRRRGGECGHRQRAP